MPSPWRAVERPKVKHLMSGDYLSVRYRSLSEPLAWIGLKHNHYSLLQVIKCMLHLRHTFQLQHITQVT